MNKVKKYFTFELLNLSELQQNFSTGISEKKINLQKEQQKIAIFENFIKLYLNVPTNQSFQIHTNYLLQDEQIPLRIIQGDELVNHYHFHDKTDIVQLVFINKKKDIQNFSEDFIDYISDRLVSPLKQILILNDKKKHGQTTEIQKINPNPKKDEEKRDFRQKHAMETYKKNKKYYEFFQIFQQDFQFIYFDKNSSQKVQNVGEEIKNELQNLCKAKQSLQESFLKQQQYENADQNITLDKWTKKDILFNMSFLSNPVRQLDEKGLKVYYGFSDKDVANLEIKKKAKIYEDELKKLISPKPTSRFFTQKYEDLRLFKVNIPSQNQENEEENQFICREQDFKQEDKQYIKNIAFEQVLVEKNKIYQFLSMQFGSKISNNLFKLFQSYVTNCKLQVSQIFEEFKLRNIRQKKNEEIYSISLSQNSNFQPPPLLQNSVSAFELTDIDITTAKCLALGQILDPTQKLQSYVKLLYGSPIDGIMVNKIMNSIEKFTILCSQQLEQINQDRILQKKRLYEMRFPRSIEYKEGLQMNSFELSDEDLITIKILAFQNMLQPKQKLRNDIFFLYGQPKDDIVVNTIMEQIEKFNLKFLEQLKQIQIDYISRRKIKKQQKEQQMGSLEFLNQEQFQIYIDELKKSTQDKSDEYSEQSICKEYLKQTMMQLIQSKGKLYLDQQDFKNITVENIIASIQSNKKCSLNLMLGYPPKDILEQIIKNMGIFLNNKISTWKKIYSSYNDDIKKIQKQLQNGLSQEQSELFYFEFGRLFVGGFKLVRLKMFSANEDEYSISLCNTLMRINYLQIFTQTQFRTDLEYESFETLFEKKGDSPSVLIDDSSNFFISFVNMSEEESTEQFLKFTKDQFIFKRNISHIIVFIFDGETKQKEHDEILKWQNNLSSKIKKLWINKNVLHDVNAIELIKEKIKEVIVDRVKDQGFIKFALFDQFSDLGDFKKKIHRQYEHPNKNDIKNSFTEYINRKCFNGQTFDRNYLFEIFQSWLEPNLFDNLQINDIVQILIHEDNFLKKKISGNLDVQIKIINLQIKSDKGEEQQNIDENEHFQLVFYVQEQFHQTQFKKINNQNQIQWKETFHVKAQLEDEVLMQIISYKQKKVWFQNRISFKYMLKSTEVELTSVDDDEKCAQMSMNNQIINLYKEKSQQDSLPLKEFVRRKFELHKLIIPQKEVQKINEVNQLAEYLQQNKQLNQEDDQTENTENQEDEKEQSQKKVNELKILKENQLKITNFLEQIKKQELKDFNCDLIEDPKSINDLAKKIEKQKGEFQQTEKLQNLSIEAYRQHLDDQLSNMEKAEKQKRVKEKLDEINKFKQEELKLKDKIQMEKKKKEIIEDEIKKKKKEEKEELKKKIDDIITKRDKLQNELDDVQKKIDECEKQKEEKNKQRAIENKPAHPHTNIRKQSTKELKRNRDNSVNQKEKDFNQNDNSQNKEQIDSQQKDNINQVDKEKNQDQQLNMLNQKKKELEDQILLLKRDLNQLQKQNEQYKSNHEQKNEQNERINEKNEKNEQNQLNEKNDQNEKNEQNQLNEKQQDESQKLKQKIEKIDEKIKEFEEQIEKLPGKKYFDALVKEQKAYVLSNKKKKKDDQEIKNNDDQEKKNDDQEIKKNDENTKKNEDKETKKIDDQGIKKSDEKEINKNEGPELKNNDDDQEIKKNQDKVTKKNEDKETKINDDQEIKKNDEKETKQNEDQEIKKNEDPETKNNNDDDQEKKNDDLLAIKNDIAITKQKINDIEELIDKLNKAKKNLEEKQKKNDEQIGEIEKQINSLGNKWILLQKQIMFKKQQDYLGQSQLNEEQKKKMLDYMVEFERNLTLHFTKTYTLLTDVFQVKKSNSEIIFDKLGDLLPIPFFKTVMAIISGAQQIIKSISNSNKKRELEIYSELFPNSEVQQQVAKGVLKQIITNRQTLILNTYKFEKGYFSRLMKGIEEKFADHDICEKIDNGAKQMGLIDATAFIGITLNCYLELQSPPNIDLQDYDNIKWKQQTIIEKMLLIPVKELFLNVKGLNINDEVLKEYEKEKETQPQTAATQLVGSQQDLNANNNNDNNNNTYTNNNTNKNKNNKSIKDSKVFPDGNNQKHQRKSSLTSLLCCFKKRN